MKHLFPLLLALLLTGAAALAQRRFQVGVRGVATSYTFSAWKSENRFRPGPAKAGYQAGWSCWFNLTRRLHLQSELNFAFVNYSIAPKAPHPQRLMRSERFEIRCSWAFSSGASAALRRRGQFRVAPTRTGQRPRH